LLCLVPAHAEGSSLPLRPPSLRLTPVEAPHRRFQKQLRGPCLSPAVAVLLTVPPTTPSSPARAGRVLTDVHGPRLWVEMRDSRESPGVGLCQIPVLPWPSCLTSLGPGKSSTAHGVLGSGPFALLALKPGPLDPTRLRLRSRGKAPCPPHLAVPRVSSCPVFVTLEPT
jgi:hypothetical protein